MGRIQRTLSYQPTPLGECSASWVLTHCDRAVTGDIQTWIFSTLLIIPKFHVFTQISWLIAQHPPLPLTSICFND